MPLLIWEKKLQESVKRTLRFGWSVRNKRGKVLVQRFYPDINKKFSVVLPIACEPNEELNVLNSLQEINEVMNKSWVSLKEAVTILFNNDDSTKVNKNVNWSGLVDLFKESIEIFESTWKGNYGTTLQRLISVMQGDYPPASGK